MNTMPLLTIAPATLTLLLAALALIFTSALLVALWHANDASRQDDAAWSDSRACIARVYLLPLLPSQGASQHAPQGASDAPTWGVVE